MEVKRLQRMDTLLIIVMKFKIQSINSIDIQDKSVN